MNYTFNQIKIFKTVVETSSITKAAKILHLSQPAVSIQLKNFQEQFGEPLTEVVNKRLFITDFGHEVASAVHNIIDEMAKIDQIANAYQGKLSGKLKIATVSTGKYVLPFFLSDFLKNYPSVELSLDVTNKARVIESLGSNSVDFGLVSVLPDTVDLVSISLMINKLYMIGNMDMSPFSKCSLEELLAIRPLIFRERGSATRVAMENYLDTHNIQVARRIELTSNEAVKQAIIAGLGISLMPYIGIRTEIKYKILQILPFQDLPITSDWNLIYLASKKLNKVNLAFVDYITQNMSLIVDKDFVGAKY